MARLMGVATHHKGGTVWIKRVIRALSHEMGVPWIGIWSDRQLSKIPTEGRAFLCNWAGWFPRTLWDNADFAALHVIRDPRDVLLSGCAYHQVAGEKGERFLHTPRADLGGRTYQDHLRALPDPEEKLLFEMEHKHAETVAEMRDWPYGDARVAELRYEDLMQDTDGALFDGALVRLGLTPGERAAGRTAFWNNSLFGGLATPENRVGRLSTHVTSEGRIRRWQHELPRRVGRAYERRFGDALRALGYERDGSWVEQLPERGAA